MFTEGDDVQLYNDGACVDDMAAASMMFQRRGGDGSQLQVNDEPTCSTT